MKIDYALSVALLLAHLCLYPGIRQSKAIDAPPHNVQAQQQQPRHTCDSRVCRHANSIEEVNRQLKAQDGSWPKQKKLIEHAIEVLRADPNDLTYEGCLGITVNIVTKCLAYAQDENHDDVAFLAYILGKGARPTYAAAAWAQCANSACAQLLRQHGIASQNHDNSPLLLAGHGTLLHFAAHKSSQLGCLSGGPTQLALKLLQVMLQDVAIPVNIAYNDKTPLDITLPDQYTDFYKVDLWNKRAATIAMLMAHGALLSKSMVCKHNKKLIAQAARDQFHSEHFQQQANNLRAIFIEQQKKQKNDARNAIQFIERIFETHRPAHTFNKNTPRERTITYGLTTNGICALVHAYDPRCTDVQQEPSYERLELMSQEKKEAEEVIQAPGGPDAT
jgi:hypothetical protein